MSSDQREWLEYALGTVSASGRRSGAARTAVIQLLADQRCALTAREISDRLRRSRPGIGQASVYRALELLDELHLVQRIDTGSGTALYEPAHPSGDHHHHAVCERCGRIEPIADDALEQALDRLSGRIEFSVQSHDVVLRGLCADCRT